MLRSRVRIIVTMLVCVSGVLAACGGDEENATVGTVPAASITPSTTATTTTVTTTTTTTQAPDFDGVAAFDDSSSVSTVGIDAVTFGMTVSRAEAAVEAAFVPVEPTFDNECYVIRPEGGPAGVVLTVTAGTIERVDITNDRITTRSGAGVGMSEQGLNDLFGASLTTTARPGGGNTITFTPSDAGDAEFRVIFETDGSVVTSFRSGRVPQVLSTESPCTAAG